MKQLSDDRSEVSWTVLAAWTFVALFQGKNAAFQFLLSWKPLSQNFRIFKPLAKSFWVKHYDNEVSFLNFEPACKARTCSNCHTCFYSYVFLTLVKQFVSIDPFYLFLLQFSFLFFYYFSLFAFTGVISLSILCICL